jgi:xanthine dehydrogenase accessory factor
VDDVVLVMERAVADAEAGRRSTLCVLVETVGSTPQRPGAMILVRDDRSIEGTIGGGCIESEVIDHAVDAATTGRSRVHAYDLTHVRGTSVGAVCGGRMQVAHLALAHGDDGASIRRALAGRAAGRPAELVVAVDDGAPFVVRIAPRPTLLVVGAGHCGHALATLAVTLDFRVVVCDDRPDLATPARFDDRIEVLAADPAATLRDWPLDEHAYVAVVTRGHQQDFEALGALLGRPVGYLGLIGSRRKRDQIFRDLRADGFDDAALDAIRSPIGLDIGAETVNEIAVSIAAELIEHRRTRPEIEVARRDASATVGPE